MINETLAQMPGVANPRGRWRAVVAVGASVGIGLLAVVVAANRFGRGPNALAEAGTALPLRNVRLTRPSPLEDAPLTLPANIEGFQCTLLYARVNGYVRTWHVEIGDRVKQGQVLAEIDTPEMDQELEQARATLIQGRADLETAKAEWRESEFGLKQAEADVARAKANLEYSLGVHTRNTALRRQGVIPQQDFDDSHRDTVARQADIDSAEALRRTRDSNLATRIAMIHSHEAAVRGYEASVRRLEEMQGFKKIVAPFDGIVTRRRAEVGMLVAAGNPQTSQELLCGDPGGPIADQDQRAANVRAFDPGRPVGTSFHAGIPRSCLHGNDRPHRSLHRSGGADPRGGTGTCQPRVRVAPW